MAAIQNDRDLLLQAASVRLVPLPIDDIADAVRGVTLTSTGTQFKVPQSGSPTPSSITFTAKRVLLSGAVSWSVVGGTATLTGSGSTTRTLTPGNMSTQSATIRASVTEAGITYTSDVTVVKVEDGASGSNGQRGTVMLSTTITGTAWSDATATNLVFLTTGTAPITGDVVTLINSGAAYAQTRRWGGSGWVIQSHLFSGDVIVEKTLSANRVRGGSFFGESFNGGTFSGATILGSQEISVTTNGNFTLQGVGVGGVRLYKAIYYGITGVWDMDLTLNQYGPTYLAAATCNRLTLNGVLDGDTGSSVLATGRRYHVFIEGVGNTEMQIGNRIS